MTMPTDPLTIVAAEEAANAVVTGGPGEEEEHGLSRGRLVLRRFLRKKLAIAGLVTLVFLFVLAFVGPHLTKWTYSDKDFNAFLQGPSASHWFGTTQIGQDVYAQTLRGLQK